MTKNSFAQTCRHAEETDRKMNDRKMTEEQMFLSHIFLSLTTLDQVSSGHL